MTVRHAAGPLRLLGTGVSLPGPPIHTDEVLRRLEQHFDVAIARQGRRIAQRLGIHTRHSCRDFVNDAESPRPGDTNPRLCARALREALLAAGIGVGDLSYIIAHTTTPHTLLPPNVSWVADELSYGGPYMELRQACCGFANALQIAAAFLAAPDAAPVVLLGSETGSVFLDPRACASDTAQMVNLLQMGDGAGAVILARADESRGSTVEHLFFGTLGSGKEPAIRLDQGGSGSTAAGGISSFRHDFSAVRETGGTLLMAGVAALKHVGVAPGDVDWIITHQASAAIPEHLAPLLGVNPDKFAIDCDRVGNLGSASIWVALHHLRHDGRLQAGQTVMVLGAEASKYMYGGFIYRH